MYYLKKEIKMICVCVTVNAGDTLIGMLKGNVKGWKLDFKFKIAWIEQESPNK